MVPARPTRRSTLITLLLLLLLAWAMGLRLWYASDGLDIQRFWDEKYSVPNVHEALENGSLRPVRYAYLRLTYLPQVVALGLMQSGLRVVDPEFSWFRGESLTPAGFLISRSIQVLIGGASILLTFLIGRRLFSAEVGLLAAFFVAASTTHLMLSVIFKPDILAVATTLLAFLLSLKAIDNPTLGRYLLAGVGIGLAVSSKPTAGAVAIPLAVAALVLGSKDRRHWLGLVSAGVTSVVIFVALNPYARYLNAFALHRKRYNTVAAQKGTLGDPLATLHHELTTVFQGAHGVWIGAAAAAGVLLLAYRAWKLRDQGTTAVEIAMVVIYPVGFLLLYGLVTQNVLPQNLLPLLPFTSLAAAVFLITAWRGMGRRWSWLTDRRVKAFAVTVLLALVSIPAQSHAYRVVVPTTQESAIALIQDNLPDDSPGWIRAQDEGISPAVTPKEPGRARRLPKHLLFWTSSMLDDIDRSKLHRADALLFPAVSIEGSAGDERPRQPPSEMSTQTVLVESRPFRSWGPPLVVVIHPWHLVDRQSTALSALEEGRIFEYRMTAADSESEIAAIEMSLPGSRTRSGRPEVTLGGSPIELQSLSRNRRRELWITDRFAVGAPDGQLLRVVLPEENRNDVLRIVIRRWSRPEASSGQSR